ncbi:MAG: MFS transporter [Anaerolineales bacterium]|nr:MFS transporter [Anaerolineales bacterium]
MNNPRFHYGWVVVGIVAVTLLISMGVRSAPGVFILPVEEDTGWTRDAISVAVSIGLIMLGLSGPLSGWLIERLGARTIMMSGLVLIAASMVGSYFTTTLWQLSLFWGILSGLGGGIIASVLGPAVANRWFAARRGLVTGIFGAATSAGQLIFVPMLALMVVPLGWRGSSLVLAAIALVAVVPAFLLMKNDPAEVGQKPYGASEGQPAFRINADTGVMVQALRSPEFWLLAGTFFICGATSNGLIGTHLLPHAMEHGISREIAAGSIALMGSMNFIGTIASGWLTDKVDPRKLLCVYYIFRGLSLFILPFVTEPLGLSAFAILFGLDYIATVPPTTVLVADIFGRKNVGPVYGWVYCAHQIGAALAAYLGGVARASLGDYGLAFLVAGVVGIAGGLLALRINRQAQPLAPAAA